MGRVLCAALVFPLRMPLRLACGHCLRHSRAAQELENRLRPLPTSCNAREAMGSGTEARCTRPYTGCDVSTTETSSTARNDAAPTRLVDALRARLTPETGDYFKVEEYARRGHNKKHRARMPRRGARDGAVP